MVLIVVMIIIVGVIVRSIANRVGRPETNWPQQVMNLGIIGICVSIVVTLYNDYISKSNDTFANGSEMVKRNMNRE